MILLGINGVERKGMVAESETARLTIEVLPGPFPVSPSDRHRPVPTFKRKRY